MKSRQSCTSPHVFTYLFYCLGLLVHNKSKLACILRLHSFPIIFFLCNYKTLCQLLHSFSQLHLMWSFFLFIALFGQASLGTLTTPFLFHLATALVASIVLCLVTLCVSRVGFDSSFFPLLVFGLTIAITFPLPSSSSFLQPYSSSFISSLFSSCSSSSSLDKYSPFPFLIYKGASIVAPSRRALSRFFFICFSIYPY